MALAADARPPCLHCGRPTPPGKWRCGECQAKVDARRVVDEARNVVSAEMARLRAARVEASRERHGDDD
jgi:hypothetical protein